MGEEKRDLRVADVSEHFCKQRSSSGEAGKKELIQKAGKNRLCGNG